MIKRINKRKIFFDRALACPFCGGRPELVHTKPFWVQCADCGSQSASRKSPGAAVRFWNCRPDLRPGAAGFFGSEVTVDMTEWEKVYQITEQVEGKAEPEMDVKAGLE